MLTLRQLLESLAILKEAQVVAGAGGLERIVQWPQVADIPGMADWLQADELLLTTAFALQEPVAQQRALVTTLDRKGVAGMVVAVGRYFDHVPRAMRTVADELDFPVVELPWQIPLLEAAKQISQQIIAQQQELLAQSLSIHQTLTQLVVQGAGLEAVAQALAQLLERSVTIEDPDLVLLAYAQHGEQDEARRLSIRQLRTPQRLANRLQESGLLADLHRSPRPVRVGRLPDEGMTMERIVAPIVAGGEILGYVWVIAGERPLNQLDFVAIEHGATVAALIIAKERAVRQATERRHGDLLDLLLSEDVEVTPRVLDEVQRLGLDPQQPHCILVVRSQASAPNLLEGVGKRLQQELSRAGQPGLISHRRGDLVVVLTETSVSVAREVLQRMRDEGTPVVAGLGEACQRLSDLYRSYREAREAADVHAALGSGAPVTAFRELGVLHWLYHLSPERRAENAYTEKIRALAQHDASYGGDLLHTLEVYLDQGANASAAAQALYLHRSTLLYRLEKCAAICDVDLSSPLERLNLHVAIKEWRLRSSSL